MIKHCVYCNFKDDVPVKERMDILGALAALKSDVDGFVDCAYGANLDFEKKSQAYDHGFVMTFEDQASVEAYAANPKHQELGAQLVSMCVGGADGIVVFDLECEA